MKEGYYQVQLIGNETSIKRMVASIYLIKAKEQEQTLKVCICDDLPHIVSKLNDEQKELEGHELLQAGLRVSVSFGRTLTVTASVTNNQEEICEVTPNYEIVIPPETVWTPGASVSVEFKVHMLKANENASLQLTILSQDEGGNDVPLSVPPRAHLIWQPKNVAGVSRLREAWESSSEGSISPQRRSWAMRQGPQPYLSHYTNPTHKSVSLPRYQQPAYSKVDKVVQRKATRMQEVEEQLRKEEEKRKWEEERERRRLEAEQQWKKEEEEKERIRKEAEEQQRKEEEEKEKRRLEAEQRWRREEEERERKRQEAEQWRREEEERERKRQEAQQWRREEEEKEKRRWEVEQWRREEEERIKKEAERKQKEEREKMLEDMEREREKREAAHRHTSQWNGRIMSPPQGSSWNVVNDPRSTSPEVNGIFSNNGDELPDWAKGLGDDFNYDDVVVV